MKFQPGRSSANRSSAPDSTVVHYIVFCGKQNILLLGHPNEKVNQATVSRLSSASDGPGIVLFDMEAGSPENSIAMLKFQAHAS